MARQFKCKIFDQRFMADDLENQVYKLEQELEKMREYYNA